MLRPALASPGPLVLHRRVSERRFGHGSGQNDAEGEDYAQAGKDKRGCCDPGQVPSRSAHLIEQSRAGSVLHEKVSRIAIGGSQIGQPKRAVGEVEDEHSGRATADARDLYQRPPGGVSFAEQAARHLR